MSANTFGKSVFWLLRGPKRELVGEWIKRALVSEFPRLV